MNTNKMGSVLGVFFGFWALVWEIVLFLGFGQNLLDWKLGLLSVNDPFTVASFSFVSAIELIVLFIIGGYILGAVYAIIYKKIYK